MKKEILTAKEQGIQRYDMDKPEQLTEMALVLKKHVVNNDLYTNIKGKNYAHVEGWQFAGGLLGLYPKVYKVKDLTTDKEIKWFAEVRVVDKATGTVVSKGFALCSNKEKIKSNFDEYAVLSMAQTRAIGKAYRNILGWVMKLAGYEGTPAEEMGATDNKSKTATKVEATKECHESGCPITEAEAKYSTKVFGSPFCREHQQGREKLTEKKLTEKK